MMRDNTTGKTVTTINFDTLAYSENMQKAGFTREQADAMARVNSTAFKSVVDTDQLATKQDIGQLKQDTAAMKQDIAQLKQDTAAMRQDIGQVKHDLEISLANTKHEILKWVIGMMLGQTTLLITAFGIGIAILK